MLRNPSKSNKSIHKYIKKKIKKTLTTLNFNITKTTYQGQKGLYMFKKKIKEFIKMQKAQWDHI